MAGIITTKRIVLTLFSLFLLLLVAELINSVYLAWQGAYIVRSAAQMRCSLYAYVQGHDGRLPDSPEDLQKAGWIQITEDGWWLFDTGSEEARKWDPSPYRFAWGKTVDEDGYIEGTQEYIIQPCNAEPKEWIARAARYMSCTVGEAMSQDRN